MSNVEAPMYDVKVPNALWAYMEGTNTMENRDEPLIADELHNLTSRVGKGASGKVSFDTLGWLADYAGYFLELNDESPSAKKAAAAALERYSTAYEAAKEELKANEPEGVVVDGVAVPPSFGLPVYHVRDTSRVVGFLTAGNSRFIPAEAVKEELAKVHE
ncbi:hypothetical protein ACWDWS_02470 [Streptomyces sp. NPDC003328]